MVKSISMKSTGIKGVWLFAMLVFAAAALILSFAGTAYADDTVFEFTVIYSDGNNWELKCGEESLSSLTGEWVNNVDNQFEPVINSKRGDSEFAVKFILPDNTAAFTADSEGNPSDITSIEYTENEDSPLFFNVAASEIIGGIWEGIEYKKTGEAEYSQYVNNQSLIRFGKGIDKGEYEVRAYAEERFEYMGKSCSSRRYCTETFLITVNSNPNPPMSILTEEDKTIVYGMSLSDVAKNRLSDHLGTYTPSENGDFVPVVTGEKQTYKFDYTPKNSNYDSKEDIEIEFTVERKPIEISIGNAQIICGEENIDLSTYDLSYYVRTPLVAGDTEETLGISFYFSDSFGTELDEIDTSVPGAYLIKARIENTNYKAESYNRYQNAFSGGRYFVFPTAIEYEIDGIKFTINRVEGFENTVPEVFILDETMREAVAGFDFTYDKENKVIGNVYVLAFKEQRNFTYEKYDEEFFVTVSQPSGGGYQYISYFKDGSFIESDFTETLQVVFENGSRGRYIYFVTLKDNIDYESGYMWHHTLLIVLSSVFGIGSIAVAVIFIKKRWTL